MKFVKFEFDLIAKVDGSICNPCYFLTYAGRVRAIFNLCS